MSENVLPAVAKSVYTNCKKCDAERYHTVLAHVTSTSAKVKCEICGSKKTYKLEKKLEKTTEKNLEKKSGKTKTPKKTRNGLAAAEARKTAHAEEYNNFMSTSSNENAAAYNMKMAFTLNSLVKHPKFGMGFVKEVYPQKIEVVFEDEIRSLVHNRG